MLSLGKSLNFMASLPFTAILLLAYPSIALGEWTHATLFDPPVGGYEDMGWSQSQGFNVLSQGVGYHLGEDWGMGGGKAEGHPVKAIGDGIVLKAGNSGSCWADTVLLLHTAPEGSSYSLPAGDKSDYVVSFYGHLSNLLVRQNQPIKKGALIGKVAPKTSCSTAAHLHFEMRKDIYPKDSNSIDGPGYFKSRPVTETDSWVDPTAFIKLNRSLYPPITPYGFAQVKFGTTTRQALDSGLYPEDGVSIDSSDCHYGRISTHPNLGFMIENRRIVRLDTNDPRYATTEGIRVGDTEQRVKAIYGGRLVIEPHKYDEHGHYLIVHTPEKLSALVMETDGNKVTEIRGGLAPAVFYVEGCL